ncbi:peptide chain release factor N(5)-glutamine methyltransferase [Candidatus Bipolaricaulota bacterium]|nr:peptide chain release factor N(5)-glutamine methyltransferase [Candidatus Bipolaricaulota bacterium]
MYVTVKPPTTVGELLDWAREKLAHFPEPLREARQALLLATGERHLERNERLSPFTRGRFRRIVEARARGVPWPVLEGVTGFLDFEVLVPPGVFIPRPETEELAELAVTEFQKAPKGARALDIGTGTGVLAIALARARPDGEVWAVDISSRALRAARRNAQRLGVKIKVRRSNLFSAVEGKFHLIVANPPYVAKEAWKTLPSDVRNFDPKAALDGGKNGLYFLTRLVREAPDFLVSGGVLLLELAPSQGERVLAEAESTGKWRECSVLPDLSGRPRFFRGYRC